MRYCMVDSRKNKEYYLYCKTRGCTHKCENIERYGLLIDGIARIFGTKRVSLFPVVIEALRAKRNREMCRRSRN